MPENFRDAESRPGTAENPNARHALRCLRHSSRMWLQQVQSRLPLAYGAQNTRIPGFMCHRNALVVLAAASSVRVISPC